MNNERITGTMSPKLKALILSGKFVYRSKHGVPVADIQKAIGESAKHPITLVFNDNPPIRLSPDCDPCYVVDKL